MKYLVNIELEFEVEVEAVSAYSAIGNAMERLNLSAVPGLSGHISGISVAEVLA